ncbi:MAG: NnrU family protein [Pseudomonadota bacterium]
MTLLLGGLAVFFSTHLFSSLRSRVSGVDMRERLGQPVYMGLYSIVALAGLVMIIYGYGAARPAEVLYTPPVWGRHLNYILMPVALVMLVSAYMPTGRIKRALKHPMLAAVKLWALGHLLANGDVASVALFGSFLIYGVVSRIAAKRRGDLGPGPDATVSTAGDIGAVVIGLAVSAALILWLHPVLFGVAIWPPA